MITDALVSWFLSALSAVFGLVPSWSAPTDVASNFVGYSSAFNRIIPLALLVTLILASLVMAGLLTLLDLGFKVYHQFWGSN